MLLHQIVGGIRFEHVHNQATHTFIWDLHNAILESTSLHWCVCRLVWLQQNLSWCSREAMLNQYHHHYLTNRHLQNLYFHHSLQYLLWLSASLSPRHQALLWVRGRAEAREARHSDEAIKHLRLLRLFTPLSPVGFMKVHKTIENNSFKRLSGQTRLKVDLTSEAWGATLDLSRSSFSSSSRVKVTHSLLHDRIDYVLLCARQETETQILNSAA